jgi:hypothetical protein
MNVMKVAIVGHDDELFMGDQQPPAGQQNQPLQAATALPPTSPNPVSATSKPPGALLGNGTNAPSQVQSAVKPAFKPPSPAPVANPSAKPQVKLALPAQPVPAKPKPAPKPALPVADSLVRQR